MEKGRVGDPSCGIHFHSCCEGGMRDNKNKNGVSQAEANGGCLSEGSPLSNNVFIYSLQLLRHYEYGTKPNQLPTIWQLFCLHTWRGFLNSWHVQSCGGHLTVYGMIKACHVFSGGGGDAVNLSTWVPDLQSWSPSSSVDATAQSLFNQLLSYGLI